MSYLGYKVVNEGRNKDMAGYLRSSAMLTSTEVARLLNVHVNTVRRWNNRGLLTGYRIGARGDRRFRQQDIASFLVEQSGKVRSGV